MWCTAIFKAGATVKPGRVPTTIQITPSISMGKRIQRGGSLGVLGSSPLGAGPKNTSVIKRREYTTLKAPASTAKAGNHVLPEPNPAASAKNISFDKKP